MPDTMHIIIKASGKGRSIAVTADNKLMEYYVDKADESTLAGALVLGRVERVVPTMGAAFVNIGQAQNGFLPLDEMESFTKINQAASLASGQELIFQIKKDAKDQKGAFLTRDIALPGQYLIYMPLNRYVGVSKRIRDDHARQKLLETGKALCQDTFGLIMREASLLARTDMLYEELHELKALWNTMQKSAEYAKAPTVLHRESVLAGLLRDYAQRYSIRITCNDKVNRMPVPPTGIDWEQVSDVQLEAQWKAYHVDSSVEEALGRRVMLKNGGTLMIDEREALSTVDVNTASFVGDQQGDIALKQNLAACHDIARQIRLRNLSGIIIIDFVDMPDEAQRAQVIQRLESELSRERVKTVVHGFTSLGFLEMTRKRTGATLRDQLCAPCEKCHATGYRLERERLS